MEENKIPALLSQKGSLELAYIGDCVYELYIRKMLILRSMKKASALHLEAVGYVSAAAQATAARAIEPAFTDEERAVFLRGRNSKPKSIPKRADHADYSLATALESLFGWLFLAERQDRLAELINMAIYEIERGVKSHNICSASDICV